MSDAERGGRITPSVLAACIRGMGGDEDEVARWVGRLDRINGQKDDSAARSDQTAIATAPGAAVGEDTAVVAKALVASPSEQVAPGNSEHHSSVPGDEPGPTAEPAPAPPDDTSQHSDVANAATPHRSKNRRKAYIYIAAIALVAAPVAGITVAKLSNQEGASATSPSTTADSLSSSPATPATPDRSVNRLALRDVDGDGFADLTYRPLAGAATGPRDRIHAGITQSGPEPSSAADDRVKQLKAAMYGRAKPDLLRKLILLA